VASVSMNMAWPFEWEGVSGPIWSFFPRKATGGAQVTTRL
jgi:hypothetical protein